LSRRLKNPPCKALAGHVVHLLLAVLGIEQHHRPVLVVAHQVQRAALDRIELRHEIRAGHQFTTFRLQ
jgi:hypothetical protein